MQEFYTTEHINDVINDFKMDERVQHIHEDVINQWCNFLMDTQEPNKDDRAQLIESNRETRQVFNEYLADLDLQAELCVPHAENKNVNICRIVRITTDEYNNTHSTVEQVKVQSLQDNKTKNIQDMKVNLGDVTLGQVEDVIDNFRNDARVMNVLCGAVDQLCDLLMKTYKYFGRHCTPLIKSRHNTKDVFGEYLKLLGLKIVRCMTCEASKTSQWNEVHLFYYGIVAINVTH